MRPLWLTQSLDPCDKLCIVDIHHWWCFNLNHWMIKWVRIYVSLKLFKRGDPPIVIDELWHQNINKEKFFLGFVICVSCGCSDLMIGIAVLPYSVSFGIDLALFSLPISFTGKGGTLGERGQFCRATHLRLCSWVFGSGSIFVFMTFYSLFLSIFCRSHSFVWSVDVSLVWQVEGGARVIDWDIATPRSSSRSSF